MTSRITNLRTHGTPSVQQRGSVLLLMLALMIMVYTTFLLGSLSTSALDNSRNKATALALQQARDALIGYAALYPETHSGHGYGYLPCPDRNGSLGISAEGSAETCGAKNVASLGRLPWKTLGLPPLRDGHGECLWYAVAGSYKNNPSAYNMMNWDNNGQFQLFASSAVAVTAQSADSFAVAAVFAPASIIAAQSQDRASDGSAPVCGGNFNPANYLDRDSDIAADNAAPNSQANATSSFFYAAATAQINDRIIFITRQELWLAIKQRNDFSSFITNMLSALPSSACMLALPAPVAINFNISPPSETTVNSVSGSLQSGRVPKSCLSTISSNWQDHLLYARCVTGSCLNVNGSSCHGIIIFAGERNASQSRLSNSDKNNWANYLEASNNTLSAFSNGSTVFNGAAAYNSAAPSTDILACVP